MSFVVCAELLCFAWELVISPALRVTGVREGLIQTKERLPFI